MMVWRLGLRIWDLGQNPDPQIDLSSFLSVLFCGEIQGTTSARSDLVGLIIIHLPHSVDVCTRSYILVDKTPDAFRALGRRLDEIMEIAIDQTISQEMCWKNGVTRWL